MKRWILPESNITLGTDDNGEFQAKPVIEPKSGVTLKPSPRLEQSGHEWDEEATIAGMSIIALYAVSAGIVVKKRKAEWNRKGA